MDVYSHRERGVEREIRFPLPPCAACSISSVSCVTMCNVRPRVSRGVCLSEFLSECLCAMCARGGTCDWSLSAKQRRLSCMCGDWAAFIRSLVLAWSLVV